MKRVLAALLLVLAVPEAAEAKDLRAELLGAPETAVAGKPVSIQVTLETDRGPVVGSPPTVVLHDGDGAAHPFEAQPTAQRGLYRARVVFPYSGPWTYEVRFGHSSLGTVGQTDVSDAPMVGIDRPPVWPLLVTAALAGAVYAGLRRQRRSRPHTP